MHASHGSQQCHTLRTVVDEEGGLQQTMWAADDINVDILELRHVSMQQNIVQTCAAAVDVHRETGAEQQQNLCSLEALERNKKYCMYICQDDTRLPRWKGLLIYARRRETLYN